MHERRRFRRVNVDLDALIQLQRNDDAIGCVVQDLSRECMGAMIATSDPRVCAKEDVDLSIFIPAERTPVNCSGRIAWYSKDNNGGTGYLVGIYVTDISRIDQRRLQLVVDGFRL